MLIEASRRGESLRMSEVNYEEVKYSILRRDGAEAWAKAESVLPDLNRRQRR